MSAPAPPATERAEAEDERAETSSPRVPLRHRAGAGVRTALRAVRSGLARFWADSLGPALGVITPVGWCVAAAASVCWILGPMFRLTEVNVLAVILTVPLLCAVLFVLGRSAYRVELGLGSRQVVVGERATGSITVSGASQRAVMPSRIELQVAGATAQFHIPRLAAGASHEELFAVPTRRRAVLRIGPVRSVRDDPLSLMRRQVTWAKAQDLYVHPRTVRLDAMATGILRDLEGTPSQDLSSSDIAFHALRDYQPGDDRRHVHWRTTARTGVLMVRQFEETRRSHVVVALDTLGSRYAEDAEFELAISSAASVSLQTLREEKQLSTLVPGSALRTDAPMRLLDDFTELETSRGRATLRGLGLEAADAAPNASSVVLVTGSAAEAADLAAASARMPLGALKVAVICVEGARPHRSRIGEMHVLTVGSLAQLGPSLRSVSA
ncbi:MAG: DUF58 domain-containing protein [Brachybacterium sp.]|nr:DUF58 domain-containing protein [Brachybacterium sp.]